MVSFTRYEADSSLNSNIIKHYCNNILMYTKVLLNEYIFTVTIIVIFTGFGTEKHFICRLFLKIYQNTFISIHISCTSIISMINIDVTSTHTDTQIDINKFTRETKKNLIIGRVCKVIFHVGDFITHSCF